MLSRLSKSLNFRNFSTNLRLNQTISGWTVNKITKLKDFKNSTLIELGHEIGSKFLHYDTPDQENFFSATFRTIPNNSKGIPHILEHLSLCGSDKYPIRDPFFAMIQRSISNYMNAWTNHDYTSYLFSSQHEKDFYNLMDVFTDACFFPRLNVNDFKQESWRYDFNLGDEKTIENMQYKGVVFNEMKGTVNSFDHFYEHNLFQNLLPDTMYRNSSGGDPLEIINLQYQELVDFHKKFYHPNNCYFFSYGNFNLVKQLEFLSSNPLKKYFKKHSKRKFPLFKKAKSQGELAKGHSKKTEKELQEEINLLYQKELQSPIRKKIKCAASILKSYNCTGPDDEREVAISINYNLGHITDPEQRFALGVLIRLLLQGQSSPLYKIIDTGLTSGYLSETGLDSSTYNDLLIIGFEKVCVKNIDLVIEKIDAQIRQFCEQLGNLNNKDSANGDKVVGGDGVGDINKRLERVIHQIEINEKQIKIGKGIGLMSKVSLWIHNKSIFESFNISENIKKLRSNIQNKSNYLGDLLEKYLINNKSKLELIIQPDQSLENEIENKLNDQIELAKDQMKNKTKLFKKILKQSKQLEEYQSQINDFSVLPSIGVNDISKKIPNNYPIDLVRQVDGVPLKFVFQDTNSFIYMDLNYTLPSNGLFPKNLQPYLPLYSMCVSQLGTQKLNRKQLSDEKLSSTTYLGSDTFLKTDINDSMKFSQGINFSSGCIKSKLGKMSDLLYQVIFETNFFQDLKHIERLVKQSYGSFSGSVASSGHVYALSLSRSQLSEQSRLNELMGGYTQLQFLQSILENPNWLEVASIFQQIHQIVLQYGELRPMIICEKNEIDSVISSLGTIIKSSSLHSLNSQKQVIQSASKIETKIPEISSYVDLPFPVNYVARSYKTNLNFLSKKVAAFLVLAPLYRANFLHPWIREIGGAYGAGAVFKPINGIFSFYTYRDPNTTKSLSSFDKVIKTCQNGEFDDKSIELAKFELFSSLDSPIGITNRGKGAFWGITKEMKQQMRDNIFKVNKYDLINASNILDNSKHSSSIIGKVPKDFK
ncbi:presequence protease [Anaeramoeba flamelloides]|uniref:Presequence protease n=1 Tax=Anaeramoeba flamelloides TaxID=1746091 RepID=A0ABQ8X724_9EUKA|nr:presequence protease [Anaeramoeba flamelloides]